ncbi:LCP family protein [Propionicicella superfundia]|uniref:LCP family protein n=1 Tax=Propionicicella superfundia TaxID=348582 RepID=UPI00042452CD|nr:LCP family protein [Propionicicella superfundia]
MEQPAERTTQERSSSVKVRRGLTLLFMNVVVPGSAQLAAGNKHLGRIALRVWGAVIAIVLIVGILALVRRDWILSVFANGIALTILAVLGIALALGWVVLLIDAWRLGRPREMTRRAGIGMTVLTAVLCIGLVAISAGAANYLRTAGSFIDTVFGGGGDTQAKQGRYNILLIGGDAGADRVGLRADSITVASVDAATGRTVLFGLPRNLEHVPFPTSSPLHELYPDGYYCADHECLLNAIYMLGEENKKLYPGVKYPGVKATTEAVEETLDLKINYFAMIDMQGFIQLIDAVGGITISTDLKVPIGGGTSRISGYIGPGKNLRLDGYHALWFARSREGSSDYERMARQKCVMNAMLHQLDPMTVFTKFSQIAEAGKSVIATDVPSTEIGTLLDLADKGRKLPIKTVSFTPPLIATGNPDFDLISETVSKAIAQSESLDAQATAPAQTKSSQSGSSSAKATTKATSTATATSTGNTDDLNAICQVA